MGIWHATDDVNTVGDREIHGALSLCKRMGVGLAMVATKQSGIEKVKYKSKPQKY